MRIIRNRHRAAGGAVAALASAGLISAAGAPAHAAGGTKLTGLLKLTAGKVTVTGAKASATGTYFRMIEPGGQFLPNPTSAAGKTGLAATFTPLKPGKDGGLKLGTYQSAPARAFKHGNAQADLIVAPAEFEQPYFSIQTSRTDAQTKTSDPVPSLSLSGTKITGNLAAWDAQWNNQSFNQGAPKPTGNPYPSDSAPVTGTYNPRTHAFTITWRSYIVGGPFSGFTGYWHLQGKLER